MKAILITLSVVVMLGTLAAAAWADPCKAQVVQGWMADRDEAVVRVLKGWLQGARPEQLQPDVLELLRQEIFLANCAPPFDINDFYLLHLRHAALADLPPVVLLRYLKRHGVNLAPASFFAGRRFEQGQVRR